MEERDFGVLLLTHGELAKGYESALKLALNMEESQLDILCLKAGEGLDEFGDRIEAVLDEKYRVMSESRKLIAGINLVIALEVMIEKLNHTLWEDLNLDRIVEDGKNSIVYYNRLVKEG